MKKSKREHLSRITADFVFKSKTGETGPFRDEILKLLDSSDEVLGKFRALVESFRNIIPDEKDRYEAIFKALLTTSGLSRQDVLKSADKQLEELKILETEFMSVLPDWQNEIKDMESRSLEIRDEISDLREKIALLEKQREEIQRGVSAREEGMKNAGERMKSLFTDIAAEISGIKDRIEGNVPEKISPRPPAVKIEKPVEEEPIKEEPPVPAQLSEPEDLQMDEAMKEIEEGQISAPKEGERLCPMCGGRMNFFLKEQKWMCYVCAYEETGSGAFQPGIPGASESSSPSVSPSAPVSGEEPAPAADIPPALKPIFGSQPAPSPEPAPGSYSTPHSVFVPLSAQSHSRHSGKKKNCPVCKKKLEWYESEKKWSCANCGYERMEF